MYFYIFVQTECVLMDKTGVCVGVCSGYRKIFAQRALPPRLIIRFRERNFTLIMFFKLKLGNTFSLRRLFYIVLATGLGRSKNRSGINTHILGVLGSWSQKVAPPPGPKPWWWGCELVTNTSDGPGIPN